MIIKYIFNRNFVLGGYYFLMLSFYLPLKFNSIALIVCGLISLFNINKSTLKEVFIFPLNLFYILFLVLLVGLLYTENKVTGYAILERHYSLIFVPVIASSFSILNTKQQKRILYFFTLVTTVLAFYFLGYAIVDYFNTGSIYIENRSGHHLYNKFMHHRLTAPLGMHAIYFSLYLSFSFILVLHHFMKYFHSHSILIKVLFFFLFSFYSLMIILLKSALFSLALPLAIIILLFFHFGKYAFSKSKYLIGLISIIIILSAFSFYGMQSKILNFSTNLNLTEEHPGPLKIRLGVWYSSWQTIQDNWLLGAGTGDGQDALVEKYHKLDFYIGKRDQFNAHNMYLQYWISNGIFAFLLYFLILILFGLYFLKKKEYVGFLVIFLFASFSFTESTMLRQSGVVFFVLFSSLYIFKSSKKNNENFISS
ncbi:O-antigen ligase family protein [Salibacter halophilus]|nr:O-antigen ligase family protein [Salibacter halophilus]